MIGPRCDTCTDVGRRGYCAPLRCYCGHSACYAFASYVEPKPLDIRHIVKTSSDAWAEREEGTSWIDKL